MGVSPILSHENGSKHNRTSHKDVIAGQKDEGLPVWSIHDDCRAPEMNFSQPLSEASPGMSYLSN